MPTLINQSFFIRDINLPNTTEAKVIERIQSFINKYEPQCLLQILGYPLYKLVGVESSARMTALLSGAEYTDEAGELQKWQGLVHDTDISLIADYVYYFIQEADAKKTTGVSTAAMKTAAAESVSPMDKMVNAWNFFSSETRSMISFLWMKKEIDGSRTYPEFSAHQYLKTKNLSRPINSFNF